MNPRAGADTWPNYLDEFCQKSNADLLSYDCYSQMGPGEKGWENYFENLRLYREAALRNGIPFWNSILSVGHFAYRSPNFDELRWQFNTTIASGAHGVLWFFYYMREPHVNYRLALVDEHWNRTPTYDDVRRIQKTFHRFYGDLFTHIVCTKVMFNPTPYGGGEKFSPDNLVTKIGPLARQGHGQRVRRRPESPLRHVRQSQHDGEPEGQPDVPRREGPPVLVELAGQRTRGPRLQCRRLRPATNKARPSCTGSPPARKPSTGFNSNTPVADGQ